MTTIFVPELSYWLNIKLIDSPMKEFLTPIPCEIDPFWVSDASVLIE